MLKEAVTCLLCTTPSLPPPRSQRLERMQKQNKTPKPNEPKIILKIKLTKKYLQVSSQKGNKNLNIFIYI